MSLMKGNEVRRLILAAMIAPALPLGICATVNWYVNGSEKWFSFFFVFGYLYFSLVGIPAIAFLLKKPRSTRCIVAGGVVAVLPVLLIDSLTFFSQRHVFTLQYLATLLVLCLLGCLGGWLFWLIAFAGTPNAGIPT